MIPKIVHFCWLSNDSYPPLVVKCIDSWKKYLPDYEFVLWDTHRIDVGSNIWLKQAYENKKYAFASDYIRFYALYNYGGIYLDADVEVLKSFDELLSQQQFVGEEAGGDIEAAIMGTEKGLMWIKECLDYYQDRLFIKSDGSFDMRPVPLLVTKVLSKTSIDIKPYYFFSPKDYNIGKVCITNETYCIHHFDGKWLHKGIGFKMKKYIHRIFYFLLGRKGHNRLVKTIRRILC